MVHPLVSFRTAALGAGHLSATTSASLFTIGRQRAAVSATRSVLPHFAAISHSHTQRTARGDVPFSPLSAFTSACTRRGRVRTSLASSCSHLLSACALSLPTYAPLHAAARRHAAEGSGAAAAAQQTDTLAVQTSSGAVSDVDAPSKRPQRSESGAERDDTEANTATTRSGSLEESREATLLTTLVELYVKLFYAFCMLVLGLAWVCVFCYAAILLYMFHMMCTDEGKDE